MLNVPASLPLPPWLDPTTRAHLQDVLAALLHVHSAHILAVILYGSLARQEARPPEDPHPSDVDLLLVLDWEESIPPEEYSAIFATLGQVHMRHLNAPREVSPMLATQTLHEWDPAFIAQVVRDGIVLYARGPLPPALARQSVGAGGR